MASNDLKATLKQVREAIKKENYSEAIEMCKAILESDSKNYMGYLLLGAAYQSNNKIEAAQCLWKAVEYSPGAPTVALQGLANCAKVEDLPKILEQLIDLVPDKATDYYEKLFQLAQHQRLVNECFTIIKHEAEKWDNQRQEIALKYLGQLWVTNNLPLDANDEELYKSALEVCALDANSSIVNYQAISKCYLKLLYRRMEFDECMKHACRAVELLPEQLFPYEWICKIYCEHFNKQDESSSNWQNSLKSPINVYANKLMELNKNSGLGKLIIAIELYTNNNYVGARDVLYEAQAFQPNYAVTLELLVKTEMALRAYELASRWLEQLSRTSDDAYAFCLSHSNEINKLHLALEIYDNFKDSETYLEAVARCYFKLGQLEKLKCLNLTPILEAEYLKSPNDGIILLETFDGLDKTTFNTLFLYGQLCIRINKLDEALGHMIQAARLQPYNAECFLFLGEIYYSIGDDVRARKCYEKSLYLNPICDKAVNILSVIYQQQGERSLNEALLLKTLTFVSGERSKEFHYRLGLHYLNIKKSDEAIQYLRLAIKYDSGCQTYWESLGEAYNERGSFYSALRIFQKICEFSQDSFYPKLQIALIKSKLRIYMEAIEDFDVLIKNYPCNLPLLKGIAEAHIGMAQSLVLDHRYGRSKEHLQLAIEHLQQAFLNDENRNMVWLWRLCANIFLYTAQLPATLAFLNVSGRLLKPQNEQSTRLSRTDLLDLALKFLSNTLRLKKNTFLWYEMASCSYKCAEYATEPQDVKKYLDIAEMACRQAIQLQSNRWQNWNLLGVIFMNLVKRNLALAQHCLIQALTLDRKSYTSWTNLGVLYMHAGDIKLANLAFQRAQQSNPTYPNAWIGQAMLAETIGEDEEAFDLFRHCQQFEYHPESSLGYAHWVCSVLCDPTKWQQSHYKHALRAMWAETVALDCINWYARNEESKASLEALSFRGLLNFRKKMYSLAVQDFTRAIKISTNSDDRDKMHTNLGYLYLKLNEPHKAVEIFNNVSRVTEIESAPSSIIGLALAYCRTSEYQESYTLYNSILKNLGDDKNEVTSYILVAMAAMVYASQGEADTKTILYQCILLNNPPIQALYAACALGILHQDKQLAATILNELKKFEEMDEHCAHVAFLNMEYYLSEDQEELAFNYLRKLVHCRPHHAELRQMLANFIVTVQMHKEDHHLIAACRIALSSIHISHRDTCKRSDCCLDSRNLLVASRAIKSSNANMSSKLAQRAVHLYPENRLAWMAIRQLIT